MYTIKLQIIDNFNKKLQIPCNIILSRFENISKGLAIWGRNTPPPFIPNTQYFEAGWGTWLYF